MLKTLLKWVAWLLLFAIFAAPSAVAHITSSASHDWNKHFLPRALAVFFTKTESDARYASKGSGSTTGDPHPNIFVRRVYSADKTNGTVVAQDDFWKLVRDGTNGGWKLDWTGTTGRSLHIACLHVFSAGTPGAKYIDYSDATPHPVGLYTDGDAVASFDCTIAEPDTTGHSTTVKLMHSSTTATWVGELTSTFDQ